MIHKFGFSPANVLIGAMSLGFFLFGLVFLVSYVPGPQPGFLRGPRTSRATPRQTPATSPKMPTTSSAAMPARTSPMTMRATMPQRRGKPSVALSLAGSGSNLPLMHRLVSMFRHKFPTLNLQVHASIGSSGGVRAVADGVVEVGLLSRALRPHERKYGLRIVPYARVPVVLAAHRSVPITSLSQSQLLAYYQGKYMTWQGQLPVVVIQRERGDSGHLVIARKLPAFREINEGAYHLRRWRVVYRDRAMQDALLAQEGAMGVFDLGAVLAQGLPLKVLAFEGVKPSVAAMASGRYPFGKTLSFALRPGHSPQVTYFLRCIFSLASSRAMKALGYLPLPGPQHGSRQGEPR